MSERLPQGPSMSVRLSWGRPVLVFVLSVAIGVVLWGVEEKNHTDQLRLEAEVTAEQAGKRLSDWVEDRMYLSSYLADKWEDDYRENLPRYRKDAAQFVDKFPGFQAINWIDAKGVIRVVVPLEGNEQVVDVDLTQNPLEEVRSAVRRARDDHRPTRTPASINLMQGGKGFATYWPIFNENGEHTGYINAVFRVNELIETCLSRITLTNRFQLAIREHNGAIVYPVDSDVQPIDDESVIAVSMEVVDASWDLYLAPSPLFYENRPFDVHYLIVPLAVIIGLFLAGVERLLALRKQALQISQAQFQKLFDQAPIGYFSARPDGTILRANQAAATLIGESVASLRGEQALDLFPETGNNREKIQKLLDAVRGGEPIRVEEVQMLRKGNGPFWALISVEAIHESETRFSHFRLTIRDISQRKESEEARSCLSAAVEQAEEGMAIANAAGTVHYVNPAFHTTGLTAQKQLVQQPLTTVLRRAGVDAFTVSDLEHAMKQGHRWEGTYVIKAPDTQPVQVIASLSPLHDDAGHLTHFVLLQRDVTQQEELQAQLRQAQKMEAIGQLAGGIAHDFNNILQSLLGYVSLARKHLDDAAEVEHCLVEIERSGHRAAELVALILAFGRKADEVRQPVFLAAIVQEVMGLVRGSLPENIVPILDIGPTQYAIVANSTQVHQILMNLISNAQHAMEDEGGELRVGVDAVNVDTDEAAQISGLHAGCYMKLSVEDSGVGIAEEAVDRIFEPYFTTREQTRGSGLGLAMVHGIVKQYGGTIRVESRPGRGTAFHVFLPVEEREILVPKPVSTVQPEGALPNEKSASAMGSILFVDDETQIVDSMTRILSHFGFQVAGYTSSLEAVEVFRDRSAEFDLVVTDLSMPDMNGIELAKTLSEIRPGIPVILCSGFGDSFGSEIERNDHLIKRYLKKPITAAKLRRAIEEVFSANAQ